MKTLQEHLQGIAKKGGEARAQRHSKSKLSEWGKKGGRPRIRPINKAK